MKEVFLFLTDGFEEIEALATVDILRRGGVGVSTVSLTGSRTVRGSHDVEVVADEMFAQADYRGAKMLVVPGGTPEFDRYDGLKHLIRAHTDAGGKVAAICAAPMVLGGMGLLEGKRATAYPGFEKYLRGAEVVTDAVVVDGDIITGRGPGLTFGFALTVLGILKGADEAERVAGGLLLR